MHRAPRSAPVGCYRRSDAPKHQTSLVGPPQEMDRGRALPREEYVGPNRMGWESGIKQRVRKGLHHHGAAEARRG